MMNVKFEMQMKKLAFAALLLGAFTLNPMAKADDEPVEELPDSKSDGMKLTELKSKIENLKFRIEGDQLIITGKLPKKCAAGRVSSDVAYDAAKKEHGLKIDLPGCKDKVLTELEKKQTTPMLVAFPAKNFEVNSDGKFCLKHSSDGDGIFACDPILGADGKQLEHTSAATLTAARVKVEQDAALKARRASREAKEKDLLKKVDLLCKAGDFAGISLELEAASEFLGDISKILDQVGVAKVKAAENALKKASTPEELRLAYDALIAEGFDAEEATKIFVERRLLIGKDAATAKARSVSGSEDAIRELENDLIDIGAFEDNKTSIGYLYFELGTRLAGEKDYDGAESQYKKALNYADNKGKVKIEQEMAKMFLAAAEACQEENKTKLAKCDALAKKAEKHASSMIAAQARIKGDDALEELNAMKAEKIQQFGISVVKVKVAGYGEYNPYGGAFAQRKQMMYQTGMQELYMQRMMQQQIGGQGMGNGLGAGTGGSFLRGN